MPTPLFNRFVERARARPQHIVLPEGGDERVLTAAARAVIDGVARITLLGPADEIARGIPRKALKRDELAILDPAASSGLERCAEELYRVRAGKGMSEAEAERLIRDPLHLADIMTRTGACDGSVAGAVYPTAEVVRAALQLIGKRAGYDLVSSFFIMVFDRPLHPELEVMVFADCALIVDPTAAELAQIAVVSADSAKEFVGIEPRVALLSFSTDRSARHAAVDKVVAAKAAIDALRPELSVVGDIQLDAAIMPDILRRKSKRMQLDAPANVLIFPDLDAGNIGYKLVERFGGAQAIGPILQGLKRPANDLSRGCSVDDIYKIITVTAVQGQSI